MPSPCPCGRSNDHAGGCAHRGRKAYETMLAKAGRLNNGQLAARSRQMNRKLDIREKVRKIMSNDDLIKLITAPPTRARRQATGIQARSSSPKRVEVEKVEPPPCICRVDRDGVHWLNLGCRVHVPTIAPMTPQRERKMTP